MARNLFTLAYPLQNSGERLYWHTSFKEAFMAEEKKAEKKTKRPTPLKRELQNQRKRLANRSFRASVSTAVRSLQDALTEKAPSKEKLDLIYSLVDKAVKRGVFKPNKASRLKSRLTARAQNA